MDVAQPLTLLTWVAGLTTRVRIGTSVMLSSYLNPVLVAKAAATLDCLSGGRLTLGISTGGTEAEYRSIGIPYGQRRMQAQMDADYSGVSATKFHDGVKSGKYPKPVYAAAMHSGKRGEFEAIE